MGTAHGGRAQICTGGMEEPGKQYPYEKPGGLEPGRFKPIEEPGAEEKDPVVFTGFGNSMGDSGQGWYTHLWS